MRGNEPERSQSYQELTSGPPSLFCADLVSELVDLRERIAETAPEKELLPNRRQLKGPGNKAPYPERIEDRIEISRRLEGLRYGMRAAQEHRNAAAWSAYLFEYAVLLGRWEKTL